MFQRDFLAAGRFVVVNRLLQLGKVVQPFLTALGAQSRLVAAFVENRRKHLGHRTVCIGRREALDELYEPVRLGSLHDFVVEIAEQRFI